MSAFDNIRQLWKRCDHFIGPHPEFRGYLLPNAGPAPFDGIAPQGMGIAAHNYALMQSEDDTRLDQLYWIDALAASFNRYIDAHRIAGDANALQCLRWWRRHLFFDPQGLAANG